MATNEDDYDTAPNEFVDALETNIIESGNSLGVEMTPLPTTVTEDMEHKSDEMGEQDHGHVPQNQNQDQGQGQDQQNIVVSQEQQEHGDGDGNELQGQNQGEQMIHNEENNKGIFAGMRFYLNRDSNAHDSQIIVEQLKNLILLNGGDVVNELPDKNSEEAKSVIVVSPYNNTELKTVTSTFIRACVHNNTLLDMSNYLVPYDSFQAVLDNAIVKNQASVTSTPSASSQSNGEQIGEPVNEIMNETNGTKRDVPTKKVFGGTGVSKTSFTEEEDEFILDVVRKNPMRRTTHTLFDEISHYVPNHTGNSIRHRYRVHLSKRLDFVYQVDQYGKLVRDANGNLIKTKVLPPSIKKKFTADEDYELAISIKKQFYKDIYQIDPDTGESLISPDDPPSRVAKRNLMMDPNIKRGSEPNFEQYKVGTRRGPIAREFFKHFTETHPTHTDSAWRDRFRKFLLEYGVDKYIEYYEREKANNNEPEAMKNLTIRGNKRDLPVPGNFNHNSKRPRSEITMPSGPSTINAPQKIHGVTADIPDNDLLDEDTMKFISSLKNDLSKIDSNFGFDYTNEIAEAIRNDFSEEEAIYDNIDPNTIPFPPPIATIDLFLPQFFRMASTQEFIEKIREIIQRDYEPSQAEVLMQDLNDEAGVRKSFTSSILGCLSGDLMVLPRFFLNMFSRNENPPVNIPGIWTPTDDEILRNGDLQEINKLIKRQGSGRVEMRKKFLERNLI
ncbi:DNA-binding protein RAP1 [Nakaseomyces bracarensis]|uniref:DNA-binding protein RAP1 n=1 Tax=Nakaseomyces bracarensis TaxID=273131 RepID=A0ABR4NNK7_9SACH